MPINTGQLPFEDHADGLYFHDRDLILTVPASQDAAERYFVPAELFVKVQRERDDFRKVAFLVNMERDKLPAFSRSVLEKVGLGEGEARAMVGIVAESRQMSRGTAAPDEPKP